MCNASDALRRATLVSPEEAARAPRSRPRRGPRRVDSPNRLVLLGTAGGSNPKSTRSGYANAIVVGDAAYLLDCGEGVHAQAWRAGIGMSRQRLPLAGVAVDAIFVTHLHSDHVIDFANLVLGLSPQHVVKVIGPGPAGLPIPTYPPDREAVLVFPDDPTPGLRKMVEYLLRAYAYNINERMADEGRHDVTRCLEILEIGVRREGEVPDIDLGVDASGASPATAAPPMEPVEVYPRDANGVRVTAILVQHAPVFPALAYRFDTPTGSVVVSGDTGPCDNLVRLAEGADVLVHEVIDVDFIARRVARLPNGEAIVSHLASSHTAPEQAAEIAERAGVRTLVLSHLVPGDDEFTEEEWEARARPYFSGEVVCGVDLDQFALAQ